MPVGGKTGPFVYRVAYREFSHAKDSGRIHEDRADAASSPQLLITCNKYHKQNYNL